MSDSRRIRGNWEGNTGHTNSLMNWRGLKTGYQSSRKVTPSKHTKFVDGKAQYPNEVGELTEGSFRVLNEMRDKNGNFTGETYVDGKKISLDDFLDMQMLTCHQRGSGNFFDEKLNIVKY